MHSITQVNNKTFLFPQLKFGINGTFLYESVIKVVIILKYLLRRIILQLMYESTRDERLPESLPTSRVCPCGNKTPQLCHNMHM